MQITSPPVLPANWPSDIHYLTAPSYSTQLTEPHLISLRARPDDPAEAIDDLPPDYQPGPRPLVRITPITDSRHPACGQSGLFAARDLRPGELVVVYMGEVHPGTPSPALAEEGDGPPAEDGGNPHAHSDYDLWLDRDGDLAIDAAHAGNEARFVNDYRGAPVSPLAAWRGGAGKKGKEKSRPNAEFRIVWDAQRGEKVMAVFVLPAGKRAIGRAREVGVTRGEEILVSYGKGFWGERRGEGGDWEASATGWEVKAEDAGDDLGGS